MFCLDSTGVSHFFALIAYLLGVNRESGNMLYREYMEITFPHSLLTTSELVVEVSPSMCLLLLDSRFLYGLIVLEMLFTISF